MDIALMGAAAAVFGLAGFVKGIIGLGMPAVAMGLLGSVLTPAEAAALLVIPSMVTNLWQIAAGPGGIRGLGPLLRRFWPMQLAVLLGVWLGAGLLTGPDTGAAMTALGGALAAYAMVGLMPWRLPRVPLRHEVWAGPLAGLGSGVMTGATGVFVIPAVPYLGALGLSRDELIQALGLSFTVSTIGLAVSLGDAGVFSPAIAWASAALLLPAVAGMTLGNRVRRAVSPEAFRRWFFLGLLALGVQLLGRGLV